jgi:RNA polymerase sigma-32 factor
MSAALQKLLQQTAGTKLLTAEEESALFEKMKAGDQHARDALVLAHTPLLIKISRHYLGYGHEWSELYNLAVVGFCRGLDRYKPGTTGADGRVSRIGTYCAFWARNEVSTFCLESASPVRHTNTSNAKRLFWNLNKAAARRGIFDLGKMTDEQADDIAAELGATRADVYEAASRFRSGPSLDQQVHRDDNEGATYRDMVPDNAPSIEDVLADQSEADAQMAKIADAMAQLSDREKEIVLMRLADDKATLQDISDRFGISRERSRQVFERALEKTRAAALGLPMPKARTRKKKGATEDAAPVGRTRTCTSCRTVKPARAFGREQSRCRECSRFATKMRALTQKLAA